MKFVSVKEFKLSPTSVWKKLPSEREMIVTSSGKPIALLIPVNDEMLEDTITAVRRAKAFNAMKKMQEISASLGSNKLSLDELCVIVKNVRRNDKK